MKVNKRMIQSTTSGEEKESSREETIFAAPPALPPEEFAACLDRACGGDVALGLRNESAAFRAVEATAQNRQHGFHVPAQQRP